jgi:hypothetical protein
MTGQPAASFLIGGVWRYTASIANRRDMNTGQLPKQPFGTPKTAKAKNNLLHSVRHRTGKGSAKHRMVAASKNCRAATGKGFIGIWQTRFKRIIEKHDACPLWQSSPALYLNVLTNRLKSLRLIAKRFWAY